MQPHVRFTITAVRAKARDATARHSSPPMDIPSSQPRNESAVTDKRRANDGSNVVQEQQQAASRAGDYRIRSFRQANVTIETLSGEKLVTRMWVSDEEPVGVAQKKVAETFKCEVCSKEFDKRQKMLLHARFHKS